MLIDEPQIEGKGIVSQISAGIYEIDHFGSSDFLEGYKEYPDVGVGPYGICDNPQQILTAYPELEKAGRNFVITLTRIKRSEQPQSGGWRWRKWGVYIGTQNRQYEYLYNEPEVEEIFCFHIYEKMNNANLPQPRII